MNFTVLLLLISTSLFSHEDIEPITKLNCDVCVRDVSFPHVKKLTPLQQAQLDLVILGITKKRYVIEPSIISTEARKSPEYSFSQEVRFLMNQDFEDLVMKVISHKDLGDLVGFMLWRFELAKKSLDNSFHFMIDNDPTDEKSDLYKQLEQFKADYKNVNTDELFEEIFLGVTYLYEGIALRTIDNKVCLDRYKEFGKSCDKIGEKE